MGTMTLKSLRISLRAALLVGILIVALQAFSLWLFGQPPICTCGYVKVWEGVVLSPGNSQHLTDWYTPSHVLHGLLFYLLLWFFFPRMPVTTRFLLALGLEAGWELFENTPWVINKYREQALAQGYTGDSIINSVMDTSAMVAGFIMARRLPLPVIIVLGIALEVFVGFMIRDNLSLNILNFLYQFEFVAKWQSGG